MASDATGNWVNQRSLTILRNAAGNPKFTLKDAQGVEQIFVHEVSVGEIVLQNGAGTPILKIVRQPQMTSVHSPTTGHIGDVSAVLKTSKNPEKEEKKKQTVLRNPAGVDLLVMSGKSKDKKGGQSHLQMNIKVPKGEKVKKSKEEKDKTKEKSDKKKGSNIGEVSGNAQTGFQIEFDKHCLDQQQRLNAVALVISYLELDGSTGQGHSVVQPVGVEAPAGADGQPYGWVPPTQ